MPAGCRLRFLQVDGSLLDDVYRHDMSLIGQVDELTKATEQLGSTADPPSKAAQELLRSIEGIGTRL